MAKRDDNERESRRIIERVGAQSDGAAMAGIRRAVDRAGDHMAAADADQSDWIEVWGTRIGRAISLVLLVVLVIWLGSFILRGA